MTDEREWLRSEEPGQGSGHSPARRPLADPALPPGCKRHFIETQMKSRCDRGAWHGCQCAPSLRRHRKNRRMREEAPVRMTAPHTD